MSEKVLIIGSGGREHAIACKLAASPRVGQLFAAPGNSGTARLAKTQNVVLNVADHEVCVCVSVCFSVSTCFSVANFNVHLFHYC